MALVSSAWLPVFNKMHKKAHKDCITAVDDFKVFRTIAYIFSFLNLIQFS